jgi:phosphatidate cytidylyltransferase
VLHWRLFFGTIFVAALVALVALDHQMSPAGVVLFPLAVIITPLAAAEMLRLTSVRDQRPRRGVVYVGTLLVVVASGVPHMWPDYPANCPLGKLGWPLAAFVVAVLLVVVAELASYERPQGVAVNLGLTLLCLVVAGLLLSFLVQLRFVGGDAWKTVPLISLLVIVKMSDTGAYTIGRIAGRHKLAPRISPGKTIEGLIGGLVFACAGAWLVFVVLVPRIVQLSGGGPPVFRWLLYAIVLTAAGVVGDLSISILKRDSGYKDSSTWLQGLGGLLDMIDSLLVAAPVAWLMWMLVLM